jgi:carbonic anhydrase/acetyltransferase-like protein (isoleucine patch superfamily)
MIVPPNSMVMGMPARIRRTLTAAEDASIKWYADNYVRYRVDFCQAQGPMADAQ